MKLKFKITITFLTAILFCSMAVPVFADDAEGTAPPAQLTAAQFKAVRPAAKAAGYSCTKIKVSWGKVEDADGYKVYRAASKNDRYSLVYATTDPDKLYYINTGRTTGKTCYYKVRAYKVIDGKTVYTRYSSVTQAFARPGKVKISKVTCPEDLCVRIYWNKVSGADGYEIYRSKKGANSWKKCDYTKDKFSWEYSKKNLYAANMLSTIRGDAYIDWQYKVRAYRLVNGKKVYGLFSTPAEWVPDWTIDEIYEELWKYGESLKWPMYEVVSTYPEPDANGNYIKKKADGAAYQLRHITGWSDSLTGDGAYVYTNPENGNTAIPLDYVPATEKNSSWGPLWPAPIFKYMTKASVLKEIKDLMKVELADIVRANPRYWDPVTASLGDYPWCGAELFTVYIKPYKNGYRMWLLG